MSNNGQNKSISFILRCRCERVRVGRSSEIGHQLQKSLIFTRLICNLKLIARSDFGQFHSFHTLMTDGQTDRRTDGQAIGQTAQTQTTLPWQYNVPTLL